MLKVISCKPHLQQVLSYHSENRKIRNPKKEAIILASFFIACYNKSREFWFI